jgi:cell division protein FtsN
MPGVRRRELKKPESMPRVSSSPKRPARVRPHALRSAGRGGTLLGVFIGLVLGLGLAATVAYFVTKANSPYQAQTAKDAREPARDAGKGGKAPEAADKPRFDFYKILPGGEEPKVQVERKVAPDRGVVEQAKERADKVPDSKAPDSKAPDNMAASAEPPAKALKAGERYWLQAGSFAAESDAENLKAQLALGGWEAVVQQGTVPDKGVRYRVRIGPYDNSDEIARVKAELRKKGFDAALIKF